MDNTDHYIGALLEHMDRKFDIVMEALAPIPQMQRDIAELKADVAILKSDMIAVKAAITNLSQYNNKHERTFSDIGRALQSYA